MDEGKNKIIVSSATLGQLLDELFVAGYLDSRKDQDFRVVVSNCEMWFEQRDSFAGGKEVLLFKTPYVPCEPKCNFVSRTFCFKSLISLRSVLRQISDQPITLTLSEYDYINVNFVV